MVAASGMTVELRFILHLPAERAPEKQFDSKMQPDAMQLADVASKEDFSAGLPHVGSCARRTVNAVLSFCLRFLMDECLWVLPT